MTKPKRKMQNVSFRHIEDMLDFLPDHEREIVQYLRTMVKDCIPHIKEKLSYNVPFFRMRRNICYIWPGAVPWGNTTFQGVQFGFTQGHLLNDELSYLETANRKFVRTRVFKSIKDIDEDMLRLFLFEAHAIDQSPV